MGLLDSILGGSSRLSIGEDGGDPIVVDASRAEQHSVQGEVSDHPVETGVDIVDHYRVLPRKLEIEAVVSDSPIAGGLLGVVPGATAVTGAISSIGGLIDGDDKPSINAWHELNRFFDDAVVVTITTSLQTYTHMVLTDLVGTRDAKTAGGLYFSCTAREVIFVETSMGAAAEPAGPLGQAGKSAGRVTNATSNAAQAKNASALAQLFPGLGK